ncbi:substrate-binding domain-containing protein [Kitasatospora sp. NBC_00458]|uniref:substrate-binding domain-containing protein n=1 Tax=Kitasatospora sp. NBC_00458 TaxID=2903568 RepID=UPI002E1822C0
MKRAFGVLAALLLLGGVAFALLKPVNDDPKDSGAVNVSGVIGSEKREFFDDAEVKKELAAKGLTVKVLSAGSWQMADNLDGMDFAFPASQPPADAIRASRKITETAIRPFYSPLVIMAHEGTAKALAANGLASQDPVSKVWTFKMDPYLDAVRSGRKWDQLTGDKPGELSGDIYLTTTDPTSSSSGAMYVALLSFLENGHQPVADVAGVEKTKGLLHTAITKQGALKKSTDEPFADFLSNGGGALVLAYESQAAELVVKKKAPEDLVVLYPDTTVYSDHTVVGLTENGRKLADQLNGNPRLRELAAQYGFRPQGDTNAFGQQLKSASGSFNLAPNLSAAKVKQAPIPVADMLQKLIDGATKG